MTIDQMTEAEFTSLFRRVYVGELNLEMPADFALKIADFGGEAESDRYVCARVHCRVCEHEHQSIYPLGVVNEDDQQCNFCGFMAAEPLSDHVIKLTFV